MPRRTLNVVSAVAGAALFSQFPAYYDQYVQRLGGRLDQTKIEIARIDRAARAEGMGREGYIQAFETSDGSPHRRHGQIMRDQLSDLQRLGAAYSALRPAEPLERPLRFARHADTEIALATGRDFAPAVPLGIAGIAYAAIGLLAGLLTMVTTRGVVRGARRRRQVA